MTVAELNNDTSLLPNHTVRFFFHDDQRVAGIAIAGAVSQVERGVVAVVGSGRSGVSQGLQYFLSAYGVPQVSPASTADLFSDKNQYPTFLRTVPPDKFQGSALAAFVVNSGWRRVCLINYLDEYASNSTSENDAICTLHYIIAV
jgi:ABC-type branched-subunit amino acid transport system substrate-binding protein